MRFNNLSHDEKLDLQRNLNNKMESIGGKFNFLKMLEDIREADKHPLSNKTGKLHFSSGTISWGKHIFLDKIETLKSAAINVPKNNLLLTDNDKLKKQILNSIKTMSKLEFTVKSKNKKEDEGFSFKAFNIINDENVEFDPIFQIVFLDSINNTKKILKYK